MAIVRSRAISRRDGANKLYRAKANRNQLWSSIVSPAQPVRIVSTSTSVLQTVCDTDCIPLSSAIRDFMEDRKIRNNTENTLMMYRSALEGLAAYIGEEQAIDRITAEELKCYMKSLKVSGYAPKTLKTKRQCIKTFFKWLGEEDLLSKDPSIRLPAIIVEERVGLTLNVQQVQDMLDSCSIATYEGCRDRLLILLLADTAGRVSEVLSIRLSNVDIEMSRIKVLGKNRRERFLNISHTTRLELQRFLRKWRKREVDVTSDYLFVSSYTGLPMTRTAAWRIVHKAGEAAGIERANPHSIRRTFASDYINSGGDIQGLQKELGHSSLQMSMRYFKIYDPTASRWHQEFGLGSKLKRRKRVG